MAQIVCVSCGSADTKELPDTVESTDDKGNKWRVLNLGRTRTEYACTDCGASFVAPPSDEEVAAMRARKRTVR